MHAQLFGPMDALWIPRNKIETAKSFEQTVKTFATYIKHLRPPKDMAMSILYPPLELGWNVGWIFGFFRKMDSWKTIFLLVDVFFCDRIRNQNGLRSIFQF